MPKVILTEQERQKAKIKGMICGKMKEQNVTMEDLGEKWGITKQGAAYRVRNGAVTLIDMWKAQQILRFSEEEMGMMLGGNK